MIDILLWNVRKSKENMEQVFEDETEYDIIAFQEVWLNGDSAKRGETYCPRSSRYHVAHERESEAAIYINKRHGIETWKTEQGHNWSAVTLNGTTVFSIYSKPSQGTA
jgi:hypothetical protein